MRDLLYGQTIGSNSQPAFSARGAGECGALEVQALYAWTMDPGACRSGDGGVTSRVFGVWGGLGGGGCFP